MMENAYECAEAILTSLSDMLRKQFSSFHFSSPTTHFSLHPLGDGTPPSSQLASSGKLPFKTGGSLTPSGGLASLFHSEVLKLMVRLSKMQFYQWELVIDHPWG